MFSSHERQPDVWNAFYKAHLSLPRLPPPALDTQRNPGGMFYPSSQVAVCRKQLQPVSPYKRMMKNMEGMGNLEGAIRLLKEK